MSYTKDKFHSEIIDKLKKDLGLSNLYAVPKLEKIVIHCSDSDAHSDSKVLTSIVGDLTVISGQKPVITKAKKSIASFKVRQSMNLGAKVTLRKDRMYEFVDRLIFMALPRVLDFKGLSQSGFDGRGNYSLGIKEQLIFPEIDYDKIDKPRGLDITVCTTASNDSHALALLRELKFPFIVK